MGVGFWCVTVSFCLGSGLSSEEDRSLGSVLDEPTEARDPARAGSITVGGHVSESLTDAFADIHVPFWRPGGHSFFLNPRVLATDDSLERYSLGGGWRWLMPAPEIILGANAYWDHLESPGGFGYEQFGAGAEILTRWLDARFNYYLPEEGVNAAGGWSSEELGGTEPVREGDYLVCETRYRDSWWSHREAALQGYYGEVGCLVPGLDKYAELRFFAGYYNYEAASDDPLWKPSYEGFKARAELRVPPAVTLDVEYVDDEEIMGGHWIGGVRVTVPFDVGNIFRGKNPFEGIGEMFRPRRREFAERIGEMVIRSPRIAVVESDERLSTESTVTRYEYAPIGAVGGSGGSLTLNGVGSRPYGDVTGGTITVLGGYPDGCGGILNLSPIRAPLTSTNGFLPGTLPILP